MILACFWGVFLVSMMVVTLTISSSFSPRETKAYDILYRLRVKETIRNKASYIVVLGVKLMVLKEKFSRKRITQVVFTEEKLKLKNQISISLDAFKQAKSELAGYEIQPEELLRQLKEKIDRDFEDIKDILGSLKDMEQQMNDIEIDQNAVLKALNESINFTNSLQSQLVK